LYRSVIEFKNENQPTINLAKDENVNLSVNCHKNLNRGEKLLASY